MDDFERVKKLTRLAIQTLKIPKCLWEDAKQEAWVAYLAKKNVITELAKWMKKERKHYPSRLEIENFAEKHPGGYKTVRYEPWMDEHIKGKF